MRRPTKRAQFPRIEIIKVDEDAYCRDSKFSIAYKFVLIMNRTPHHNWVEVFNRMYRKSFYNVKQATRVVGNRIEMIVADSDNPQNHAIFAKCLVEDTNRSVQSEGFLHVDVQTNTSKAKAFEEFAKI